MIKLILAKSYVMTCASCGHWMGRWPQFYGDGSDSKGDCCEKCGCTSANIREGRPYGNKSRDWENITKQFAELWRFLDPDWDDDTVVTEPPLPEARKQFQCPKCQGSGYFRGWNCDRCMSTGVVEPEETALT